MTGSRVIVWFSCGAASAVAAKLCIDEYKYPPAQLPIVYCDTQVSEHPDNKRFLSEVSEWIGRSVTIIKSSKYQDIDEVFNITRYMAGQKGARCTVEMKKIPRNHFQRPDDWHVFGFTVDEGKRIAKFEKYNPELNLLWILRDNFIRKSDCYDILRDAGIALPKMYELGFDHNNCIGCVKATSPAYWQRVAKHFPETFARRAEQSRGIRARLVRVDNKRIYLDEMDLARHYKGGDGEIECGPFCENERLT